MQNPTPHVFQALRRARKGDKDARLTYPMEQSTLELNQDLTFHYGSRRDAADATNTNTNANNTSFRQMLREANTKQHQRSAVQATEIALDERAVNSVINDLRAACVFRAPDVLPYLRTLTDRLTEERAQWKRIAYR